MGTSSSTIQVGRALHALLSDAPVEDEVFLVLLDTSLSNAEIERAIPFLTLRTMRHYYTRNFALLLFKCIEVLANALAASRESPGSIKDWVQKIQNALSLMRRMLPIAFENGDTSCDEGSQGACGIQTGTIQHPKVSEPTIEEITRNKMRTQFTGTFVHSFFVEGLACDDENPDQLISTLPDHFLPLSKYLGRLLVDCCFIRGLTLNDNVTTSKKSENHPWVDESLLWYSGLGGGNPTGASREVNATTHAIRYEILNTLTVFLSYPLFNPPGTRDTLFTEQLINVECVPLVQTLVASALNAILSYAPYGTLPYTSHLVGKEESVVQISACFISAVLCYPGAPVDNSPIAPSISTPEERRNSEQDVNVTEGEDPKVSEAPLLPLRRKIIHSAREFVFAISADEARHVVISLQPIIGLKIYANRTYLPDSQRCFLSQDEFMMILWKLIDLSPECFAAFGRERAVLGYLLPLVDYAIDAKRDPKCYSHLQLVLFILLKLTEIRTFCLLCNSPFRERIPFEFDAFVGSYGDLLILTLCTFMMMHNSTIRPFHETCSLIISNLAPFMTSVCPLASKKLSLLFASVATRCLAYRHPLAGAAITSGNADEVTDQVVMFIIVEAVASMLQYHEAGAASLLSAFIERSSLVVDVSEAFAMGEKDAFRLPFTSPFLIRTLREAISAVEKKVRVAVAAGKDPLLPICDTTLVGCLPTPHRIIIRRLLSTWQVEEWAMSTHWSSLYMHSVPGTFGDRKSIRMLCFV